MGGQVSTTDFKESGGQKRRMATRANHEAALSRDVDKSTISRYYSTTKSPQIVNESPRSPTSETSPAYTFGANSLLVPTHFWCQFTLLAVNCSLFFPDPFPVEGQVEGGGKKKASNRRQTQLIKKTYTLNPTGPRDHGSNPNTTKPYTLNPTGPPPMLPQEVSRAVLAGGG